MAFFGVDIDLGWLEIASIGALSAFVIYQTTHRPPELPDIRGNSRSDDDSKCETEETNSATSKGPVKRRSCKEDVRERDACTWIGDLVKKVRNVRETPVPGSQTL